MTTLCDTECASVCVSMFLSAQCAATTGVIIHTHISFMTACVVRSCSGYSSDNISDIYYSINCRHMYVYSRFVCIGELNLRSIMKLPIF